MRAVMLAAGVGSRLGDATERPKCLLAFEGKTLLARHIERLHALGISELVIAVGFQADVVEAAVAALRTPMPVRFVRNPDYREGNIVTLWHVREAFEGESEFLLMDADVLYDRRILSRLVTSSHANCMLLDRDYEPGDEPVKICLRDGAIVEFRKIPDAGVQYTEHGESVGFFKLDAEGAAALLRRTEGYIERGARETPYEDAIRDLILSNDVRFGVEDITGLGWIEIDFAEDIARANTLLPTIE
ncbi:MAG: phosphocholine cytidylyltransferase family protein [Pseudomonadota bacterium]